MASLGNHWNLTSHWKTTTKSLTFQQKEIYSLFVRKLRKDLKGKCFYHMHLQDFAILHISPCFCIVSYMTLCLWLFVRRIEMTRFIISLLYLQAVYSMYIGFFFFNSFICGDSLLGKTSQISEYVRKRFNKEKNMYVSTHAWRKVYSGVIDLSVQVNGTCNNEMFGHGSRIDRYYAR